MSRVIEITDHNPEWPKQFSAEAASLRSVFGSQLVAIHHVGSTAIPEIKAKPIIDILVEIKDIKKIEAFTEPMITLGYRARGECLDNPIPGTPGRFYFSKDTNGVRSHQVHVCQVGHFDIGDKLRFRDYMRTHPLEAQEYSALKQKLAKEYRSDSTAYNRGKDKFIKEIIAKAKIWSEGEQNG